MPPPVTVPPPEMETVSMTALVLVQAALTERSSVRCTVHVTSVSLHAPPQPVKTCPEPGVSRTVSVDPVSTVRVH
jgi:hypothetical protein